MLTSGVELLRSPTGCETCGSCWGQPAASWMVGRRTPFPSRTTVLTSHRRIWPSGPEMVMRRQAASCWQKLRTDRSLVFPMQRTPDEEAGHWWPTPSQESGPLATERLPGCCVILEDEQALAWCPSGRKISRAESSGESVWTIWSRLPCWCTKQPRRCRTSGALPETWVEAGTELHSETLPPSLTDLYAGLPAVETTSLAAYGSPAAPPIRDWRHLWIKLSLSLGHSVKPPAAPQERPTKPPDGEWSESLKSCLTSTPSPGTISLTPTTGLGGGVVDILAPEWPWMSTYPKVCGDPWRIWAGVISNDPGCSGFWPAFWVEVPRCRRTCWTACR